MVPAEGEPVLSVDVSPDGRVGIVSAPRIELVGVTRRYDVGDTQVTAVHVAEALQYRLPGRGQS